MKHRWLRCAMSSLMPAFYACVIVPLHTCLSARDIFDYPLGCVLAEALPICFAVFVALFAVALFLDRLGVSLIHSVYVGIAICLYFETGLFSIGIPPMNGAEEYIGLARACIDALSLIVVFAIVLLARKMVREYLLWFFCGFFVMAGASLADISRQEFSTESPMSADYHPRYDVVRNAKFSTGRNVLIFVIDSVPATVATKVVEDAPQLKEHFPGFTAYRKNLGMQEETAYGMPGLVTGKYFDASISRYSFAMTMYGEDSFLMPYYKAGAPVFFAQGLNPFGVCNRFETDYTQKARENLMKRDGSVFFRNSSGIPYIRLIDVVNFRLAPYWFKDSIYKCAIWSVPRVKTGGSAEDEKFVYSVLANAQVIDDDRPLLGFYHTIGVHPPVAVDYKGNRLPEPKNTRAALYGICHYKFTLLAELFDELRSRGIYDNSTIIVMADHGCILMREGENYGSESALLWIKPENAKGAFRFDDSPTSHCKVVDVVRALFEKKLSQEEMRSFLIQDRRMFRANYHGKVASNFGGKIKFTNWFYDKRGSLLSIEEGYAK